MPFLLAVFLVLLLFFSPMAMDAAGASCRLFVQSVLPGLFPYMTLSLMLSSRLTRPSPRLVLLMGWCGGSPTGARLLRQCPNLSPAQQKRLLLRFSTMSPIFLTGTLPRWTGSRLSGLCILAAVLLGGYLTGGLAASASLAPIKEAARRAARNRKCPDGHLPVEAEKKEAPLAPSPLTFSQSVEQAAQTMLLVCGIMAMLRILSAGAQLLLTPFPALQLACVTALEVTCGAQQLAALPLPLCWRTALLAGATGFGGAAILMQNRAVQPRGLLPLWEQCAWQMLHGAISFLLALGMMCLLDG